MAVAIYRNKNRGDWSIAIPSRTGRSYGLVIDHRRLVLLAGVTFFVSQSGRDRVVRNQVREVHAWAIGEIVDAIPDGLTRHVVTYNPYHCGAFVRRDDGAPVQACAYASFTAFGVVFAYD
jgi:hypothetical protein